MKIKACIFFSIGLLMLAFLNSCEDKSAITMIQNGASDYVIATRNQPSEKELYAAKELQKYLEKISSVKLPLVEGIDPANIRPKIIVSNNSIEANAISIRAKGEDLHIVGGSDESTLNAVYAYLETELNCKWYAPEVEDIPEEEIITFKSDLNYTYSPEITTRTVHSRLFYQNPEFAAKHKVTTEAFPNYVPGAKVHTFHKFVPEETYYKKHPEYFALRGDQRLPTQLCLTNPDVLQIVIDSVASYFKKYPEATVISVSQNDNQQYCQDAACKKIDDSEGGPSGTMIQFVNKVAQKFPDKIISTLAYQYTRTPCVTRPEKNVMITLCSIECDRSASIEDKCTDFASDLIGWNKISDNIRIWDYTTQFTNFLAPFPNLHTLQPNIVFFKNNNAKWIFEQHSNNPSELFELRSYLTAKLLWEPEADVAGIIEEFTEGYYGEGGKFVVKYINSIHESIQKHDDFFLFLYGDPSQAFTAYLSPEKLLEYDNYFNEAEKVVLDNPELLERIKRARLGVDYAILEACRKNLTDKYSLISVNETGQKSVNPFVIDKLDNFSTTTKASIITLMNEMRYGVDDYESNYRKALEVALKPNIALGKKVYLNTKPKKYAKEDPQVLTDGALGGNGFYANWLGFEGNHMEAIIDLGTKKSLRSVSTAFLQVTNHVVFFPLEVSYYYSLDNKNFIKLGTIENDMPLNKNSKVNDIKYFDLQFDSIEARYIKIVGINMMTPPYWHHAAGTNSWIFADEVLID